MKKIQEKIQKQTQKILSTYTADVSGVCSALFELGGMTVMHDASGCNSTYNTHDEPRWYDSDSLVFLSGLTEMEAILGDDQRLSADIVAAARELQPRFIAIAGSPIPALTGCDLPAIAASIEAETGICTCLLYTARSARRPICPDLLVHAPAAAAAGDPGRRGLVCRGLRVPEPVR